MTFKINIYTSFSCSSLPSILESVCKDNKDINFRFFDLSELSIVETISVTQIVLVRLEDLIYDHPEQRAFSNLPDAEERKKTMKNEGFDTTLLFPTLLEYSPLQYVWSKGAERLNNLLKKDISSSALIIICPSCPAAYEEERKQERNQTFSNFLQHFSHQIIHDTQLLSLYQCKGKKHYYDSKKDLNEHTPYLPEFESLLAYISLRYIHSCFISNNTPKKVIVLDCDNTLWGGVVGEDGTNNVKLTSPYISLQRFFKKQQQEGLLLTLASKNTQEDVTSVFSDRKSEMLLSKDDITDYEIGWEKKSLGILRMAVRLSLDVSSFIFVDDSEVECAEVKNALPSVTVVCLPPSPDDFEKYLYNHWIFDTVFNFREHIFYFTSSSTSSSSLSTDLGGLISSSSISPQSLLTDEDVRRTQLYKEQAERQASRPLHSSFASFITDLGIKITISPLLKEGIPRAVQLSVRTNQLNANKRPYSADDFEQSILIREQKEKEKIEIDQDERIENDKKQVDDSVWTIHASDRFGAYGVVGLLVILSTLPHIYSAPSSLYSSSFLFVESFLLSCRVLQRGVEQYMLRHLGLVAQQNGLDCICIRWVPSERNEPMRSFLFNKELQGKYISDFDQNEEVVNSTKMRQNEDLDLYFNEKKEVIECRNYLALIFSGSFQHPQSNLPPASLSRRECRFGIKCERLGLDEDHSRLFVHSFLHNKEFKLTSFIDHMNVDINHESTYEGDVQASIIVRARLEREKRRVDRAFLGGRPSVITEKPKSGYVFIKTTVALSSIFNPNIVDEESERAANLLRNAGEKNEKNGKISFDESMQTISFSKSILNLTCSLSALGASPNFSFLFEHYLSSPLSIVQKIKTDHEEDNSNRMELRRKARKNQIQE
jgi:HAD superfamily phosphatase (TIGR01681 family)